MSILDFKALERHLREHADAAGLDLRGPADTEFGMGWEPTTTFWHGDRRVHFYVSLTDPRDGMTVEIAGPKSAGNKGRTVIESLEQAWTIVEQFLHRRCTIDDLTEFDWASDDTDHDKFIPHPPDGKDPANIVSHVRTASRRSSQGAQNRKKRKSRRPRAT